MTLKPEVWFALALSILLHVVFVVAVGWFPVSSPAPSSSSSSTWAEGRPLSVHMADVPRAVPRRAAPLVPKEEYLKADIEPILGQAPVLVPVPAALSSPHPGTTPGTRGGSAATGSGSGKGLLACPATVRRVVYLIDRSISMGPTGGLDRARRELRTALTQLPPDAFFQIVLYNQGTEFLLPPTASGLLPVTPDTVERALARLDEVFATGTTNHLTAFQTALFLQPEDLFLITDADDFTPALVQAVTRLNRKRTRIHVIEFSHTATPDAPLMALAHENGGQYGCVKP